MVLLSDDDLVRNMQFYYADAEDPETSYQKD